MKKTVRKCVVCEKKFTPKVANQTTCSEKCRKIKKALRDNARKAKAKLAKSEPVALKKGDQFKANGKKFVCVAVKGKAVEKIVLPKKTLVKKPVVKHPKNPKIDTIITVKCGDPFKVYFLASLIREKAKSEILQQGKMHFFDVAKRSK